MGKVRRVGAPPPPPRSATRVNFTSRAERPSVTESEWICSVPGPDLFEAGGVPSRHHGVPGGPHAAADLGTPVVVVKAQVIPVAGGSRRKLARSPGGHDGPGTSGWTSPVTVETYVAEGINIAENTTSLLLDRSTRNYLAMCSRERVASRPSSQRPDALARVSRSWSTR